MNNMLTKVTSNIRHTIEKFAQTLQLTTAKHRYVTFNRIIKLREILGKFSLLLLFAAILLGAVINYLALEFVVWPATEHAINIPPIAAFKSLLLTFSGALLGATAIALSFVMFAIQSNIEKLPYRLFRQLSSDKILLCTFGLLIVLALMIGALSLVVTETNFAIMVSITGWTIFTYFSLSLAAFRRALTLVSPQDQIKGVLNATSKDLRRWRKRGEQARPIIEANIDKNPPPEFHSQSDHDLPLFQFYSINSHWTLETETAIQHAISFFRRYCESGDVDVARLSLGLIVSIHNKYIEAKGKTFFCHPGLVDNPLARDKIIIDTLELLRQNIRIGVARHDENQIELTCEAIARLCHLYIEIDYSQDHAQPSHATLAAGYLSSCTIDVLRHEMPDVVMASVKHLSRITLFLLAKGYINQTGTIIADIVKLASIGASKSDNHPITTVTMEHLSELSLGLIVYRNPISQLVANQLHAEVCTLATNFLYVNSVSIRKRSQFHLGEYFFGPSATSFLARLTDVINNGVLQNKDDQSAAMILQNLGIWAQGSIDPTRKLFADEVILESDTLHAISVWASTVSSLLVAASTDERCSDYVSSSLQESARRLSQCFLVLQASERAAYLSYNWSLTDYLFEVASNAIKFKCEKSIKWITGVLLSWAWHFGRFNDGKYVLEMALTGVACTLCQIEDDFLKAELEQLLNKRLDQADQLDQLLRENVAKSLNLKVERQLSDFPVASNIDRACAQVDRSRLNPMLLMIAQRLSTNGTDN